MLLKPKEQAGEGGIFVRAFKHELRIHAISYTGTVDPDLTLHFDDPDPIILFLFTNKIIFL